jgi:AraC-like DNA-binding protein
MLQNKESCEECFCHRDNESPVVEYMELPDAAENAVRMFHHSIVFVIKGSVHVSTDIDHVGRTMREWEFVFVPMGGTISYKAAAGSAILIVRMMDPVPECHVFRIDKIAEPLPGGEFDGRIYPLTAGERMRHGIEGLIATLGDGLQCRNYLRTEVAKLIYVLHAYHSREEYLRFFSSVVSSDLEFSEFVRLNWMQHYPNVDTLALAMNMPYHRFVSRFWNVFGVSPRSWMVRRKAQMVYRDICTSGIPLTDIIKKYGFNSPNFHQYCTHAYGESARVIRKRLTAESSKI